MCKKRNICQRPSFSTSSFFYNKCYVWWLSPWPSKNRQPSSSPVRIPKIGGGGETCVCVILPAAIPPFSLHLSIGSLQLFLSSSSSSSSLRTFSTLSLPPFSRREEEEQKQTISPPLFPLPLQATSLTFTLFLYRRRERRVKLHIA